MNRHQLYENFHEVFPFEKLSTMSLEEYTNLNRSDSFCYWVEAKLEPLGSIWGATAYKFGIFQYANKSETDNTKYVHDDKYSWYARYGKDSAQEAFDVVRKTLIQIAELARNHDLDGIDKISDLNGMFKWKVAFLYSNEWIVPIYSEDKLKDLCFNYGMVDAHNATVAELQAFLIEYRGNKNPYVFFEEMLSVMKKMDEKTDTRVWIYSPGENARKWEFCRNQSLMCLGWDEMGDFMEYNSRDDIKKKMQNIYSNPTGSFKMNSLALWEFAHVVKVGDIIIAKEGRSKIIGKGIVESDYYFDNTLEEYKSCRKVRWTNIGSWDAPFPSVLKTLTDITKYPDYVKKLNSFFETSKTAQNNITNNSESRYWWVVAKPGVFSISDMKVGDVQSWTLFSESGHKRGGYQNFLDAKKGDIIIGYEATPVLQIVAFLEVEREADGKDVLFKKTEQLRCPIDYSVIKNMPELQNMEFIKNHMGSFFKVTEEEYDVLIELIRESNPLPNQAKKNPKYGKENFLEEVFMTDKDLDKLEDLLLTKKNIILQGAPGVGKTFTAKRLAYTILGEEDDDKVEMIQFHQNYSYEDFVMGYKPTEVGGFSLRKGIFYSFCKKAKSDPKGKYFFIIDEINRGNLSKIFGELLMLIENGYREKNIKLAYNGEDFSVPKNLYIIGMMNTADRSLAMIDYALRRRFSFYNIKPGFDSNGFKAMQKKVDNEIFNDVVEGIKSLNKTIEKDLGSGFCIGHSYFCVDQTIPFDESWLNNIIDYDIEPMLNEYWFDDKEKCDQEIKKLKDLF